MNINTNTPGLHSRDNDLNKITNFDMLTDLTIFNFPLKYKAIFSTYFMCYFSFYINVPTFNFDISNYMCETSTVSFGIIKPI